MRNKRDDAVVHVFLSLLGVAREVVVDRARARADACRMAASAEYHQARLFETRSVRIEEAVHAAVLTLAEAAGEPQNDPVAGDATTPCATCEEERRSATPGGERRELRRPSASGPRLLDRGA